MVQTDQSKNKKIAKNATMLYIRMFFSMAISFYTSRIVLKALGVSDFGIYNVVGGIIVLVNMLSTALNSSTSRFLTYSLGENDPAEQQRTFSTAFFIHCGLAALFLVIAETIGLWFVNTQLVIPEGRLTAANWVYQSAIISTIISITQVPYNSLITSHEHFGVFAAIDIINSCLKLGIAFIVLYSIGDHLITYSILYATVAIMVMLYYRFYCIRHFTESRLQKNIDKELAKRMLTFSGWNLFGNASLTLSQQGLNIILNWFFGTVINAASGIALQVQGILYAFIGNITTAFNPQIIKEYAAKNFKRVTSLINEGTKFASICTLIISVPIIIKMDFLMSIWLDKVPSGAIVICQILIIKNFLNSFNPLTNTAIMASEKVKSVNLLCGLEYLLSLFIIYVIVYFTHSYIYAFIFNLITSIIACGIYLIILKKQMPSFSVVEYVFKIIVPATVTGLAALLAVRYIDTTISNNITSLLVDVVVSTLIIGIMSFFLVFNKSERNFIISKFKAVR